ncbi:hypothetical protein N9W05_04560 [Alphaproteobacteria bacterium]|nr:hypothetical protein [Alphaproteobacteria bacterium]
MKTKKIDLEVVKIKKDLITKIKKITNQFGKNWLEDIHKLDLPQLKNFGSRTTNKSISSPLAAYVRKGKSGYIKYYFNNIENYSIKVMLEMLKDMKRNKFGKEEWIEIITFILETITQHELLHHTVNILSKNYKSSKRNMLQEERYANAASYIINKTNIIDGKLHKKFISNNVIDKGGKIIMGVIFNTDNMLPGYEDYPESLDKPFKKGKSITLSSDLSKYISQPWIKGLYIDDMLEGANSFQEIYPCEVIK